MEEIRGGKLGKRETTGGVSHSLHFLPLDLSSLHSVHSFVQAFLKRWVAIIFIISVIYRFIVFYYFCYLSFYCFYYFCYLSFYCFLLFLLFIVLLFFIFSVIHSFFS